LEIFVWLGSTRILARGGHFDDASGFHRKHYFLITVIYPFVHVQMRR
jgi:hypothetical protein